MHVQGIFGSCRFFQQTFSSHLLWKMQSRFPRFHGTPRTLYEYQSISSFLVSFLPVSPLFAVLRHACVHTWPQVACRNAEWRGGFFKSDVKAEDIGEASIEEESRRIRNWDGRNRDSLVLSFSFSFSFFLFSSKLRCPETTISGRIKFPVVRLPELLVKGNTCAACRNMISSFYLERENLHTRVYVCIWFSFDFLATWLLQLFSFSPFSHSSFIEF